MKIKVKNTIPEYRLTLIKHFEDLNLISLDDINEFENALFVQISDFATNNNIRLHSNEFIKLYMDKYIHILLNIDNNSYVKNDYMYEKIKNNEFKLIDLLNMAPRDMCPDKWAFYKNIEEANINAISQGGSMLCRTKVFICSRCKKNDTEYYERQSRSADEPSTFYISCVNCKKKWTQ
jgi:DNA-directed RNA polymerase subunit M/transcription elongation factor TFIIS